ncbi:MULTISPECIES: cysteine hydrolase family protein [Glutamicibacter]|uniref:cysteine hydrolase family protein n=1 Tax=Glutamicibacter TaxID=1742989 RepID=UPI0009396AB8|nr:MULTISPECIES: cysteine hydrolase [Glutamicibacter]QEP08343.1 cysteine hydrolase [Glutamicibacter sp. ZJUTW]WIV43571.1 cysteine hydrolase [Glutamicibacter nicotianae]
MTAVPFSIPVASAALVLIDMQRIFQDPESQWFVANYDQAAAQVARLRTKFDDAIWTRFVRDAREQGAWQDYYDRWDQCRQGPDSPQWDLTLKPQPDDGILSLPTFSKWGHQLAELTSSSEHLVIAGVATDCCVLATVLGAVDAGKRVTVVTDACAGATHAAHQQALGLMELLNPMVQTVSVEQVEALLQAEKATM